MKGSLYIYALIQILLKVFSVAGQISSYLNAKQCIPNDAYGVQREVWSNLDIGWISSLKSDWRYPGNPTIKDYITTLEAPRQRDNKYGQTLTAYFVAPETGNHVFYMACDDECELLVSSNRDPQNALVVINVRSFTNYRDWEGRSSQRSSPIHMIQGHLYYVRAIMTQIGGDEHLSIGIRLPSGVYDRPLTSKHVLKYPLKGVENLKQLATWGEWSPCTATCGGGVQVRSRVCLNTLNSSFVNFPKVSTTRQTEERVCEEMKPCPTPPEQIEVQMVDSWSVRVTWRPFAFRWSADILLGYKLIYKRITHPKPLKLRLPRAAPIQDPDRTFSHVVSGPAISGHMIIPASFQSVMLSGLDPFTEYCIRMTTLTIYWESTPSACVNVTTDEFIPSLPPTNVTALNRTGSNKIKLTWSSTSKMHQNGRILGYKITIRAVNTKSEPGKPAAWTMVKVGPKMETMVAGLETNTLYQIRVAAFTSRGTGPFSKQVHAKTCRCPKTLHTNWWALPPLAIPTANTTPAQGILPTLLRNVIDFSCGFCREQRRTVIDFRKDNLNRSAMKSGIREVKHGITAADVSFPIAVKKGQRLSGNRFHFVPIVELSGGVVYINRKLTADVYARMLGSSVYQCWPMVVVIVLLCCLAGTILCILEIISYPLRACYRSSFLKGVFEYTWCAFTTMTTVGYGDRYPRSIQGRIFTILWSIVGWIVISVFVANLASSLSVQIVVLTRNPVRGGKVGVLESTPEYKVAMTINGTKGIQCVQYSDMDEMLTHLNDGIIDGIMLDALSSKNLNETILPPSVFQVAKTFHLPLHYGIVLSGNALKLKDSFTKFVDQNPVSLQDDNKNKKKVDEASVKPSESPSNSSRTKSIEKEKQINFFDPSNSVYLKTMHFASGFLIGAVLCGVFFHYLTSRQHLSHDSEKEMSAKYQYLRSLDRLSLHRDALKSLYLRCLMITNHLREKHIKEQQLLQHLQKYNHISLKECTESNANFSKKDKPNIKHHREFIEYAHKETAI